MGIRAVANYTGKRSCHRMPSSSKSVTERVTDLITSFSGPKVWYDPSDITTLQQDATGLIPVTAAGQPIGRIMDKSGAANHATQLVTLSSPLWQTTYAAFDGTNDSWVTASINFTSTNKMTMIVGLRKATDTVGMVSEFSAVSDSNAGTFAYLVGNVGANTTFRLRGSTAFTGQVFSTTAAPVTEVDSCRYDLSQATSVTEILVRTNGATATTSTVGAADAGTGNFGNYPLFIGRRNDLSLPFNGNLYGLIIIGRLLTLSEVTLCEQYMAQKAGIVI